MYTREYVTNLRDYYSNELVSGYVYRDMDYALSEEEQTYLQANIHIQDKRSEGDGWLLPMDRSAINSHNFYFLETRLIEWARAEYDEDFPNSFEGEK